VVTAAAMVEGAREAERAGAATREVATARRQRRTPIRRRGWGSGVVMVEGEGGGGDGGGLGGGLGGGGD
jgi:hypothetical protein